jgi:hypothetical protein
LGCNNITHRTKQDKVEKSYSNPYEEDLQRRLHKHLTHITTTITTDRGDRILVNKYDYRSSEYLKNIYAGESPLPFVIDLCDLTEKAFIHELLNAGGIYVLAREVQTLLKNTDPKLYRMIGKNTACQLDDYVVR